MEVAIGSGDGAVNAAWRIACVVDRFVGVFHDGTPLAALNGVLALVKKWGAREGAP